jgi:nucleotide-binding universal stress UspA family protein
MTVDRRTRYLERLSTLIGADAYRYRHPDGPERAPKVPHAPRPTGRIVVGVDGSAGSVTALRWAAEEAARRGVPLLAVAAYRRNLDLMPALGARDPAQVAQDMLAGAIEAAGAGDVETLAVEGPAAVRLEQLAADADLLVVGTRGRGPAGAALLGSVSMHCVSHATCPVVVVPGTRQRVEAEDRSGALWARGPRTALADEV